MHRKIIGCIANFRSSYALELQEQICSANPTILKIKTPKEQTCEILITIGGDGFLLRMVNHYIDEKIEIFGINAGNLGFLLNKPEDLSHIAETVYNATRMRIGIFHAELFFLNQSVRKITALNEVGVIRNSHMALNLEISVNNQVKLEKFVGDGVMLAGPIGSTAYNLSAGGHILPPDANIMALTPINPFIPKRWQGALLHNASKIKIDIATAHHRKGRVFADNNEYFGVQSLTIEYTFDNNINLLFRKETNLYNKIMNEQFR